MGSSFSKSLIVPAIIAVLSQGAISKDKAEQITVPAATPKEFYSPDGKYKLHNPAIFQQVFGRDNRHQAFQNFKDYAKAAKLLASDKPLKFNKNLESMPNKFSFKGQDVDINEYLNRSETMGLLVIKNGKIKHEKYYGGATDTSTFTSWSVAKSFVSTLVGIAIDEGKIKSVKDKASDYVATLKGTAYGDVSIEHLLQMSSGIDYSEIYPDPEDDVYKPSDADISFLSSIADGGSLDKYVSERTKKEDAGEVFDYRSIDTHVLSWIVREATGRELIDYMQEKLFSPLGMEGDAFWNTDDKGKPIGYCCLNMRLKDYAKLGGLFLNNGFWNGQQIVSAAWTERATIPTAEHLLPTAGKLRGYQYQWWVPYGFEKEGEFMAVGIWGQHIYVNRAQKTIVVRAATDPNFGRDGGEPYALYRALSQHYADSE